MTRCCNVGENITRHQIFTNIPGPAPTIGTKNPQNGDNVTQKDTIIKKVTVSQIKSIKFTTKTTISPKKLANPFQSFKSNYFV